jgi:hypothetical protein
MTCAPNYILEKAPMNKLGKNGQAGAKSDRKEPLPHEKDQIPVLKVGDELEIQGLNQKMRIVHSIITDR